MKDEFRTAYFPLAREIVTSRAFSNFSMAEKYREIQNRTDIDFTASIRILERLPVFLNGEAHKKNRRAMANRVALTKQQQMEAVVDTVGRLIPRHFIAAGQLDLVTDISQPIWRAISQQIVGEKICDPDLIDKIPELFDPTLSIRRRLEIDSSIASVIKNIDDEKLTAIALSVLGAKPFQGSLSLSIYDAAKHHRGKPLREYDWGGGYQQSALEYVDRICTRDTIVAGENIFRNERVRCITHSDRYSAEDNLNGMFGYGAHLCLGRAISQFSFEHLTKSLNKLDCYLEPVSLAMANHCQPFKLPASAIISVEVEG